MTVIETLSDRTWQEIGTRLRAALAALADHSFVVLSEPPRVVEPPVRRRWYSPRPKPEPVRFVQAVRVEAMLGLECIGASSFGGDWPIDASDDAALRRLGWLGPGDPDYDVLGAMVYQRWWPHDDAEGAAALLVASLDVLGVAAAGPLELRIDA